MNGIVPLADFGEVIASVLVPMVIMIIPVTAILTRYRLRLEEMRMSQRGENSKLTTEVEGLRTEVKELKEQLHQQMISVDNLLATQQRPHAGSKAEESISDRLSQPGS